MRVAIQGGRNTESQRVNKVSLLYYLYFSRFVRPLFKFHGAHLTIKNIRHERGENVSY